MTAEELTLLETLKLVRCVGQTEDGKTVYEFTHAAQVLADAGGDPDPDPSEQLFDPEGCW